MTDAELDQCRHNGALLFSLVSNKVKLKRVGHEWKGLCPFHTEKTPSFTVFEDGHYHCFGCNAHGSVFDFIMETEHVDFPAAVRRIEAEPGSASPKPKKVRGETWQPIVPSPVDAPDPPADLVSGRYEPFEYVAANGSRHHYQRRVQKTADKKDFYPLTYGTLTRNGRAVTDWHSKGPPQPYPLYRLDRLSTADPDSFVLVVEGEGKCQSAERLFPDFACTAWMGGANAVDKSDWSVLRRFREDRIIWWADADVPRSDGKPHGCFIATPAFLKLFPHATQVETTGLADIKDGYDAKDLEQDVSDGRCDDPDAWLAARLKPAPAPPAGRILTGAAFIARHVPPVWLIDGVVQRSRLYACTSLTGHGKTAVWLFNACMIHAGRMIGNLDVFQGNVLILAGENPADLEARMIGMAKAFGLPLNRLPYVLPGSFPLTEEEADALKRDIAGLRVPLAAIIGDTASSFFPGDDENSNVQAGTYARTLRGFNECEGSPAIMALCHPTKGAGRGNLLPRGGGAFLNELDGNLALWSHSLGEVTELHWCGKIRGPDFSPLGYRLRQVATGLTDEKDRPEMTIVAEPMSEEAVADHTKQALANDDVVLRALRDQPGRSLAQIARDAGWLDGDGTPEKWRVQRAIASLLDDKLIQKPRKGAEWELTDKGKKVLDKDNL